MRRAVTRHTSVSTGRPGLHNPSLEGDGAFATISGHLKTDACGAIRFSEYCDRGRIATEMGDVRLNPFECESLIEDAWVEGSFCSEGRGVGKAENYIFVSMGIVIRVGILLLTR
jgi:hypothetical protein